jgi:hypothetical protein
MFGRCAIASLGTPHSNNRSRRTKWRMLLGLALTLLILVYVTSYFTMSRRGFKWADQFGFKGYFFYPCENTDEWRRWEYGTRLLFCPLILLEDILGTGQHPGNEPLWKLSAVFPPNMARRNGPSRNVTPTTQGNPRCSELSCHSSLSS